MGSSVSFSFIRMMIALMMMCSVQVESFGIHRSSGNRRVSFQRIQKRGSLWMSMDAYDEQMKKYYGTPADSAPASAPVAVMEEEKVNGFVNGNVNGYEQQEEEFQVVPAARTQTFTPPAPVPVSAPAPQQVVMAPNNEVVSKSEGSSNDNSSLIASGIAFLGLPLWILLSVQLFFNSGDNAVSPTLPSSSTTVSQMTLPATVATTARSDASTAGVVVLSQPITKQEVRDLFNLWNSALQTLDPATVAKRYAKDGVLLPTLSDVPRTDFEGIKDYFVGFLSKKPVGKILEGEIFIGNNWAQDAGKFFDYQSCVFAMQTLIVYSRLFDRNI